MDRVLQEVWQAAKDNNLSIKSVRNSKPIEGTNYSEQPIRMVVEGPFYPSFFKFLNAVEQMDRLTKIKEMKIDADEKNNGAIIADFTLTIYYESSEKVAVAP
jgi:Tfp pilus assembly protein PilO